MFDKNTRIKLEDIYLILKIISLGGGIVLYLLWIIFNFN